MKTIIAGSRTIDNYNLVSSVVEASGFSISEVVIGAARGVDSVAIEWAIQNEIPFYGKPAKWTKYDDPAGNIRNREMAEYAEALIAVWNGESSGTKNMIKEARKRNLKIFAYRLDKDSIWTNSDSNLH